MLRRIPLVAVAAAVLMAGCGGSTPKRQSSATATATATATARGSGSTAKTVAIGADPGGALKFTKKTLTTKAGKVTFKLSNPSQTPHALEIEGHGVEKETKVIVGGDARLVVQLKPGTYEFYCPVPGHKAAGMQGTLTVQ